MYDGCMTYGYYNRVGEGITRDEWRKLTSDDGECIIRLDEVETEYLGVQTKFYGIGPTPEQHELIYTTSVYVLPDVLAEFKTDFSRSSVLESVHLLTEEEARAEHVHIVGRVYRGVYRGVLAAALSGLEARDGS
jgi:hypothetical protein